MRRSSVRSKWWGWGQEGESYHLADPGRFWSHLRNRLGDTDPAPRLESLTDVALTPSRLSPAVVSELCRAVGQESVSTEVTDRVCFSFGKGYKDIVRIRRGEVPQATEVVVRPQTEEQVLELLRIAAREQVAVVPFGGGTSVVGGVEPAGERPSITLDLAELSRPLGIDKHSATATGQAGIMGPDQ